MEAAPDSEKSYFLFQKTTIAQTTTRYRRHLLLNEFISFEPQGLHLLKILQSAILQTIKEK